MTAQPTINDLIARALSVPVCAHDVALSDECRECDNPTGEPAGPAALPCTVCAAPATTSQLSFEGSDRPTCTKHQQTGDRCYVCRKPFTARVFELDGTARLVCARHIAHGTGQPGFGGIHY